MDISYERHFFSNISQLKIPNAIIKINFQQKYTSAHFFSVHI